jgi:predicted nucleic acid-binding protein
VEKEMKLLPDSSVWIDHLHVADGDVSQLSDSEEIYVHRAVIGELACGTLAHRSEVLAALMHLPKLPEASFAELLALIDRRKLWGRGLSWMDVQLLGACLVAEAKLWTHDPPLQQVAAELPIGYSR